MRDVHCDVHRDVDRDITVMSTELMIAISAEIFGIFRFGDTGCTGIWRYFWIFRSVILIGKDSSAFHRDIKHPKNLNIIGDITVNITVVIPEHIKHPKI